MNKKHQIRENFRNAVFKRDGYKCRVCGRNDVKLDAHHITSRKEMPNGGYVKENGITLCDPENDEGCHMLAERCLSSDTQSEGVIALEGFDPDSLYKLIGSSYELAVEKSKKL